MAKRKSKKSTKSVKSTKVRATKRKATAKKRGAGGSFYIDKVPTLI